MLNKNKNENKNKKIKQIKNKYTLILFFSQHTIKNNNGGETTIQAEHR
jgi:hypothetical protein